MQNARTNFVDQEYNKLVTEMEENINKLINQCENVENSVQYFLNNEQYKIVIKDPSAAVAEKQMKSLASFFNDKKDLLEETIKSIDKTKTECSELISKLESNNYVNKIKKVKESEAKLIEASEPLLTLIDEVNSAKKKQLADLKLKILKAERVKHFKHLK